MAPGLLAPDPGYFFHVEKVPKKTPALRAGPPYFMLILAALRPACLLSPISALGRCRNDLRRHTLPFGALRWVRLPGARFFTILPDHRWEVRAALPCYMWAPRSPDRGISAGLPSNAPVPPWDRSRIYRFGPGRRGGKIFLKTLNLHGSLPIMVLNGSGNPLEQNICLLSPPGAKGVRRWIRIGISNGPRGPVEIVRRVKRAGQPGQMSGTGGAQQTE